MSLTTQQLIDRANETTQQTGFRQLLDEDDHGLGYLLANLVPGFKVRSGLTSSATHVEDNPGTILAVLDAAGTTQLTMLLASGAVAGAGEVAVTYDAAGVPTLVFGDGANTGYQVLKLELPKDFAAALASIAA
jgi:hypothetical protein